MDLPTPSTTWPTDLWSSHLKDMADTVTRLELWQWFREENPPEDQGYLWWQHENIDKISRGLPDDPHSGASFAYAMRTMQYIALNGFKKWNSTNKKISIV